MDENQIMRRSIEVIASAFAMKKPDAFGRAMISLRYYAQLAKTNYPPELSKIASQACEEITKLMQEYGKTMMRPIDEGETPESRNQPWRGDSLASLGGSLTHEQVWAGRQIQSVVESVVASLGAKGMNLNRGTGGGKKEFGALSDYFYDRYSPWCKQLCANGDRRRYVIAHAVIVSGIPLGTARRVNRLSFDTSLRFLRGSLDLYAKISREADD
jgi:hypothetical protein